jgi:hypothetical protein
VVARLPLRGDELIAQTGVDGQLRAETDVILEVKEVEALVDVREGIVIELVGVASAEEEVGERDAFLAARVEATWRGGCSSENARLEVPVGAEVLVIGIFAVGRVEVGVRGEVGDVLVASLIGAATLDPGVIDLWVVGVGILELGVGGEAAEL